MKLQDKLGAPREDIENGRFAVGAAHAQFDTIQRATQLLIDRLRLDLPV